MKNGMNTDDNTFYYVCKNTFFQQEATMNAGNCSFPCLPCMERQRLFKSLKDNKESLIKNWAGALEETYMLCSEVLGDGNDEKILKITEPTSELDDHFFPDRFFLLAKFKNKKLPNEELETKTVFYVSSISEKEDGSDADNNLVISNSILFKTCELLNHNQLKKLHEKLFENSDFFFLSKRKNEIYEGEQEDVLVEMFIAKGDAEVIEKISDKRTTLSVPNETRKMYLKKWNNLLKLSRAISNKKPYFELRKHHSVKNGYNVSFLNFVSQKETRHSIFTAMSSNPTVLQNNLLDDIKSHLSLR